MFICAILRGRLVKGIVYAEMKSLFLFTHPRVVSNMYNFLFFCGIQKIFWRLLATKQQESHKCLKWHAPVFCDFPKALWKNKDYYQTGFLNTLFRGTASNYSATGRVTLQFSEKSIHKGFTCSSFAANKLSS